MNTKLVTLIAAISLSAFALASCSLLQHPQAQADLGEVEKRVENRMEQIEKRMEEAEKRTEEQVTEERSKESAQGESQNIKEAVLKIEGDPQTEFSGSCAVGDQEEKAISGRVPQSFNYELNGQRLECEIRNESGGEMEVDLKAGNDRYVQRTNAQGATIRLTYSERGISSSTISSSGDGGQFSSSSSSQTSTSSSAQTQVVVSD